jgi:galactose-6-phosphate isomerase
MNKKKIGYLILLEKFKWKEIELFLKKWESEKENLFENLNSLIIKKEEINSFHLNKNKINLKWEIISKLMEENKFQSIIVIDDYAIAPFILLTKYKNLICAPVTNEYSALMTRKHNNSNVLILGWKIIGKKLIESIINLFLNTEYERGRHQARINQLINFSEENYSC